jgi:hypothetical protein
MQYTSLVKRQRPRVLLVDFSPAEVEKIRRAGYDAQRAATGLHDRNVFHFPCAVQDVDIAFIRVSKDSFLSEQRSAGRDSVEDLFCFRDLVREVWDRAGWVVLFIAPDVSPLDLERLEIGHVGVFADGRRHLPSSSVNILIEDARDKLKFNEPELVPEIFPISLPSFRGQKVIFSDDREAKTLQRFIGSAKPLILTCLRHQIPERYLYPGPNPAISFGGRRYAVESLVCDESSDQNVLACRISNANYVHVERKQVAQPGGILLLPTFSDDVDVALALLQDSIQVKSAHLFDSPQHGWLSGYTPRLVENLQDEHESFLQEAIKRLDEIDARIRAESDRLAWLPGLLTASGADFEINVSSALQTLGFEVERIDAQLEQSERKREDFWIRDTTTGFFAIGEAKTTGKNRGASEDFITKTTTHQMKYARDNKIEPPAALLFVNFATDIDPKLRTDQFYGSAVDDRLAAGKITAINSVALFDLCQLVLASQITPEAARQFLCAGKTRIARVDLADIGSPDK